MAQQSGVASSQLSWKRVVLQLVDEINTAADIQPALTLGTVSVLLNGCGFSVCTQVNIMYWFALWRSSVRKASCVFKTERHEAAKEKLRRQKE